ncbi:MAG TPA: hypothetical protein VGQ09_23910 [Chitinophagaceae bacterium]|jgi:hypothetical protein|nr:hypothetical protein [Chitinophagaceae bacterium]
MEEITSIPVVDKIMAEIWLQTKNYNEAIKNNRPLSEAKQIRNKIKELVREFSIAISQNEN